MTLDKHTHINWMASKSNWVTPNTTHRLHNVGCTPVHVFNVQKFHGFLYLIMQCIYTLITHMKQYNIFTSVY